MRQCAIACRSELENLNMEGNLPCEMMLDAKRAIEMLGSRTCAVMGAIFFRESAWRDDFPAREADTIRDTAFFLYQTHGVEVPGLEELLDIADGVFAKYRFYRDTSVEHKRQSRIGCPSSSISRPSRHRSQTDGVLDGPLTPTHSPRPTTQEGSRTSTHNDTRPVFGRAGEVQDRGRVRSRRRFEPADSDATPKPQRHSFSSRGSSRLRDAANCSVLGQNLSRRPNANPRFSSFGRMDQTYRRYSQPASRNRQPSITTLPPRGIFTPDAGDRYATVDEVAGHNHELAEMVERLSTRLRKLEAVVFEEDTRPADNVSLEGGNYGGGPPVKTSDGSGLLNEATTGANAPCTEPRRFATVKSKGKGKSADPAKIEHEIRASSVASEDRYLVLTPRSTNTVKVESANGDIEEQNNSRLFGRLHGEF